MGSRRSYYFRVSDEFIRPDHSVRFLERRREAGGLPPKNCGKTRPRKFVDEGGGDEGDEVNYRNQRRSAATFETGRKAIRRAAECKYLTLPRLSNPRSSGVQGKGLLKGSPRFPPITRVVIKGGIELTHCMSVAVRSVTYVCACVYGSISRRSHAAIEFIIIIRPEYCERTRVCVSV